MTAFHEKKAEAMKTLRNSMEDRKGDVLLRIDVDDIGDANEEEDQECPYDAMEKRIAKKE